LAAAFLIDVFRIDTHQLECTHDTRSAGELIEREQAKRIAHDNRHAGTKNTRSGQPTMCDDKSCETQISLGLATARREEQQVGNLAVCVFAIGKSGDVEQDEGQLEWSPFGCRLRRRIACRSGIAAPGSHRDGQIHESESGPRSVVACQNVDPLDDSLARGLHFGDEPLRGFAPTRGKTGNLLLLNRNPFGVKHR
jgi:hypothetical protein